MAVVYIWEFSEIVQRGPVMIGKTPGVTTQTVNIGGASAQSAAFSRGTSYIRVHTDAICSINIGANAVASATTPRMAANTTEYFGVNPGDVLAVITNN